jgi:hypothetical protein
MPCLQLPKVLLLLLLLPTPVVMDSLCCHSLIMLLLLILLVLLLPGCAGPTYQLRMASRCRWGYPWSRVGGC